MNRYNTGAHAPTLKHESLAATSVPRAPQGQQRHSVGVAEAWPAVSQTQDKTISKKREKRARESVFVLVKNIQYTYGTQEG